MELDDCGHSVFVTSGRLTGGRVKVDVAMVVVHPKGVLALYHCNGCDKDKQVAAVKYFMEFCNEG